ncbi:IclR family transcriptional regulator [Neisseria montereyensis]|uniref:Helix-turn-helix domain-containing protein n=1 Tax=Neisseria montereyensis TaxID=2973938 RepID=A0ABT2FCJ8_9NEIS|nr:helix-turn-helix domain-containing protein [Neisseria montereyensis]MCS4533253.1 helix-turn-helix domain-containing protein [Neisseria montereyensis]
MTQPNKTRHGVKSIEIGLSILDILIDHKEPMKLKDIASAMQMPAAKIHRYLVSMVVKNYVKQLSNGYYTLGERINSIRQTGLEQTSVINQLNKIATEIKNNLNCGVQIAKWFNEGPVVIQSIDPNNLISINTRIGSRMPIASSATGQLLASYQPLDTVKPLVLTELQSNNPNESSSFNDIETSKKANKEDALKLWHEFELLLPEIKKQGFSYVIGNMMTGINAFSIAVDVMYLSNIQDFSNTAGQQQHIYAITAIGTAEQLPASKRNKIIKEMLAIVQHYRLL